MKVNCLLLTNTYANGAAPQNCTYEVVDAHGHTFMGTLDASGQALVEGLAPGPATVRFGTDSADPWAESSYFGCPEWPPASAAHGSSLR